MKYYVFTQDGDFSHASIGKDPCDAHMLHSPMTLADERRLIMGEWDGYGDYVLTSDQWGEQYLGALASQEDLDMAVMDILLETGNEPIDWNGCIVQRLK